MASEFEMVPAAQGNGENGPPSNQGSYVDIFVQPNRDINFRQSAQVYPQQHQETSISGQSSNKFQSERNNTKIKLKKEKEEDDQLSPIEFLIKGQKEELKSPLVDKINLYFEKYNKKHPENVIRRSKNCLLCIFKSFFEIDDFKKSLGFRSIQDKEKKKRFYGNIYFDNEDQNFIISQTLKHTDIQELEKLKKQVETNYEIGVNSNSISKQIMNLYDDDQLKIIQMYNQKQNFRDKDYEDLNNGYFQGKRCGYGFEIINNINESATFYIGEFFNNKYHGKGILENENSEVQDFFAGEREKKIFSFLYEGQKQDKPPIIKQEVDLGPSHGKATYHGEVNNENDKKKEGWGVLEFQNGNKYKGQWKDDKMHGTGHFTWSNGEEYLGEYFKGKKHGFGQYKYVNNKVYLGQFKEGKQHGLALMNNYNTSKFNLYTTWYDGKYQI